MGLQGRVGVLVALTGYITGLQCIRRAIRKLALQLQLPCYLQLGLGRIRVWLSTTLRLRIGVIDNTRVAIIDNTRVAIRRVCDGSKLWQALASSVHSFGVRILYSVLGSG